MRLLVVNKFYHPQIGGVEQTIQRVCEGLTAMGHDVVVACSDPRPRYEEIGGVQVHRLPLSLGMEDGPNPSAWMFLHRALREGRFDLVNVHNYHSLLAAQSALLCEMRGTPCVFVPHYHGKGHTPLRQALFRVYRPWGERVLARSDLVICNSEYERSLLLSDVKGLGAKLTVIGPGIKDFPPVQVEGRGSYILFVGRLMRYKGLDHLLRAVKELSDRGRKVDLRVVGKGPDEAFLKQLAKGLGLEAQVRWLGDLDDQSLAQEYRSAGLLALLSAAEAYGLVVAEALSLGTPCLIAEKAALVEFLKEPGVIGVPNPGDHKAVADAIVRILDDEEGMRIGFSNGKVRGWTEACKEYERAFEAAIGGKGK